MPSLPAEAGTLSIPDVASAGPSAGSAAPSSSTPMALVRGFLVTRSHGAPALIALTALIALALCAALAVHLLAKEARS